MKMLVMADLHYVKYEIWQEFLKINQDNFDIIVLLGDIDALRLKTLKETFPHKKFIGVLGNHDTPRKLECWEIENVHGRTLKIEDITFAGLEGSFKYKISDRPLYTQEEASEIMSKIGYSDIVLSHNSPYGIHDKPDNDAHTGFIALREYIEKYNPKFCLHGHQHTNKITEYGNTIIIGLHRIFIIDTDTNKIHDIVNLGNNFGEDS